VTAVRAARRGDADAAATLILEPGGLRDIVEDRTAALRIARAAFVARGTALSHERAVVAVEDGNDDVVGFVASFLGEDWRALRVRTGLVMLRSAGLRHGRALIVGGREQERAGLPIPREAVYVMSLAVAPGRRGCGIGGMLLSRVVEQAVGAGARVVVLDTAPTNVDAIRFYERHGFAVVGHGRTPRDPRWATVRLERRL